MYRVHSVLQGFIPLFQKLIGKFGYFFLLFPVRKGDLASLGNTPPRQGLGCQSTWGLFSSCVAPEGSRASLCILLALLSRVQEDPLRPRGQSHVLGDHRRPSQSNQESSFPSMWAGPWQEPRLEHHLGSPRILSSCQGGGQREGAGLSPSQAPGSAGSFWKVMVLGRGPKSPGDPPGGALSGLLVSSKISDQADAL